MKLSDCGRIVTHATILSSFPAVLGGLGGVGDFVLNVEHPVPTQTCYCSVSNSCTTDISY